MHGVKGEVVLVHATEAYSGSRGIAQHIQWTSLSIVMSRSLMHSSGRCRKRYGLTMCDCVAYLFYFFIYFDFHTSLLGTYNGKRHIQYASSSNL